MTSRQLCNVSEKVASAYQSQLTSFLTDQRNIAKLISFLTSLGLTVTMGNNNMLFPVITGATGYALTTSILKALKDTKDDSFFLAFGSLKEYRKEKRGIHTHKSKDYS